MKLEVGMYVRTKYGIEKIKFIDENFSDGGTTFVATDNDEFRGAYNGKFNGFTTRNDVILKASHNIIDLIEEHDYIRIITSTYFEPVYYSYGKLVIRDDIDISKYTNKFIAEVITHEQMKSMSYKLED